MNNGWVDLVRSGQQFVNAENLFVECHGLIQVYVTYCGLEEQSWKQHAYVVNDS